MKNEIFVKYSSCSPETELKKIGFDLEYLKSAELKYKNKQLKIFNLKSPEANILKQLCLSLGFDCAVSKGVINCQIDYTNALMTPSDSQLYSLITKLKLQPYRLKTLAEELERILKGNKEQLNIRGHIFDWTRPYIVGILNVTPDSFSDGGEYASPETAIQKAKELIDDGADIIDIGGESTRPGYEEVSEETELNRVLPVIEKLRKLYPDVVISIDTRKSKVAKKALTVGADIINDIDLIDDDMISIAKEYSCPVVVSCNKKFEDGDIVENVYEYFNDTIVDLMNKGLERKNIILDVAIGFNKTLDDNFELVKRAEEFNSLNQPIYWGISRKSFIWKTFGLEPKECDLPSLVYSNYLISHGADFIRSHEVKNLKKSFEYLKKMI